MEKDEGETEYAIGIGPATARHIKKRALRNKALSISFDENDLKNFVTGFHKRKQKRRKEAEKRIKEKERLRRIEKRKQRRLEKAFVQGGGAVPANDPEPEIGELEEDKETKTKAPIDDTKTYDTGALTIKVITKEIFHEEDEKYHPHIIPGSIDEIENKHSIPVKKKEQFKPTSRNKSFSKLRKKQEKRKGKTMMKRR